MKTSTKTISGQSRRAFIGRSALALGGAACLGPAMVRGEGVVKQSQVVVFSKVYQALKLDFAAAAALTAEAGFDGVDVPVRPGGEILPDQAALELPRYAEALNRHNLHLPLLTTAIVGPASPYTEEIVKTARRLGVQSYRLGFIERQADVKKQIADVRAQLKELAALNRRIGVGAVLQNHSPTAKKYLGGDLNDLAELVQGFEPGELGVAFDIGHALVVHGDEWRKHFEVLKRHIRTVYVKDVTRDGKWVPFGQGAIGGLGYFELLRSTGFHGPVSLHVEFDWDEKGKSRTREALLKALKESLAVLRPWLAAPGRR